ncbi:MAG: endopeptidase La [Bacteroidota bacterium]
MMENYKLSQVFEDESDFLPVMTMDEDGEPGHGETYPDILPILALKNTVLFPGTLIPITVGRSKSINAINLAYREGRLVGVVSQKDANVEDPEREDLYNIGTIARIMKLMKMPDGTLTVILQGRKRFLLGEWLESDKMIKANIQTLEYVYPTDEIEFKALMTSMTEISKQVIELSSDVPDEVILTLSNINNDISLLNFIASNLRIKVPVKQEILETHSLSEQVSKVLHHLNEEHQLLMLKSKIDDKVKTGIEKQQRDYFLNQQLKTIQEELGQTPQEEDLHNLVEAAKEKKWGESIAKSFAKDIQKLRRINPQAAEYSVILNYLELLIDLPWGIYSEDNFNLHRAKEILDSDHYGLEKVKDRILEHLAVLKLKGDMKAPILCLVGPPGVGKTSLGKSIAKALDRKFIRMSLGGLHDESEIRGHRKTYIGAMPGRIVQSIKRAGTSNPVFILDEIDKIGKDFRGDPSSALLEVLDPEQNETFYDNYLELEYDLSKILFIATANSLNTLQPALLDRMEIIEVSGYSIEEKLEISKQYLIPQQREEHGLKEDDIDLKDTVVEKLIQEYTRESGVRSLKRVLGAVMRSTAKKIALEEPYDKTVKKKELVSILGPSTYSIESYQAAKDPGVAIGLAWTPVGGDILFIEVSLSNGKGRTLLTGNLGEVMKESATTALSFIKSKGEQFGIEPDVFEKTDVHIHIPQGAIPKDGPSAGVTMLSALTSAFTKRKLKPYLAMTGEITLRGKVLPVGGIKEKLLAAKRSGIKNIIMCTENKKHVDEIEKAYLKDLQIHYVDEMMDVLDIALDE